MKEATVIYKVLFKIHKTFIESQKVLCAIAEIGKWYFRNTKEEKSHEKLGLRVIVKEHALIVNPNKDLMQEEDALSNDEE